MISSLLSSPMVIFLAYLSSIALFVIFILRVYYYLTVKHAGKTQLNPKSTYYAIVTGSNTGIGEKTAELLAARQFHTILAVRSVSKGEEAKARMIESLGSKYQDRIHVMKCDLSDLESVRSFCLEFKNSYPYLDVLVANAGLISKLNQTTKQDYELTYGVCYLGHVLLTELLIPHMLQSKNERKPRIVGLTSMMHKKIPNTPEKLYWKERMRLSTWPKEKLGLGIPATSAQYSYVKFLNVLYGKILHDRFFSNGILCNTVHPGIISSSISRQYTNRFIQWIMDQIFLTPEQGSQTTVHCAACDDIEKNNLSGLYWSDVKPDKHHPLVDDKTFRDEIWEETLKQLSPMFISPDEIA